LAEGEETFVMRKLSLLDPPKENPFAGLRPDAIDLHWLRESLYLSEGYFELDKEFSPWVFDTFLLTSANSANDWIKLNINRKIPDAFPKDQKNTPKIQKPSFSLAVPPLLFSLRCCNLVDNKEAGLIIIADNKKPCSYK
jgi:hypothetical protein